VKVLLFAFLVHLISGCATAPESRYLWHSEAGVFGNLEVDENFCRASVTAYVGEKPVKEFVQSDNYGAGNRNRRALEIWSQLYFGLYEVCMISKDYVNTKSNR
jgi:hypothetical protein